MIAKDVDFYAWAEQAAACLRAPGELTPELRDAIAEEIEDMGRSERREVYHRLSLILAHKLKWDHQPLKRSGSWVRTLQVQRSDLRHLLNENPSLEAQLSDLVPRAYWRARYKAAAQTGLDPNLFAQECPYTLEQILRDCED
jgi:hypothetical protein